MMNIKQIIPIILVMAAAILPVAAQTIERNQAVSISVQGVPDADRSTINSTYPVSQNGTINMPYIGEVRAAGLLPERLAANLQERYREAQIYTNPTFQVIATSSDDIVQQVVTVGGYVGRPGPVPYRNGLTLWQAIQAAGGENAFGSIRRVRLFRGEESREYDLRNDEAKRIPLRPNDTIEVPQKNIWGQ